MRQRPVRSLVALLLLAALAPGAAVAQTPAPDWPRLEGEAVALASSLLTGATVCRYFRVRGIPCYGFMPFKLTPRDFDGFHGNNERLSVENVHSGMRLLYEIVRRLAVR